MGGTIDGVHGDHVLLAPPFICTDANISEIVARFVSTVSQILPA
jgi:adenosylmethionine-8-amino-7-oxononanoate aminotransferase